MAGWHLIRQFFSSIALLDTDKIINGIYALGFLCVEKMKKVYLIDIFLYRFAKRVQKNTIFIYYYIFRCLFSDFDYLVK